MDCPVTARPTVIVISDSLGDTACEVVLAASGQFDEGAFRVLRLPKVTSVEQVKSFVGPRVDADHRGGRQERAETKGVAGAARDDRFHGRLLERSRFRWLRA